MNFTNFFSFLLYPGAQNSDNLNCRSGRGGDSDGGANSTSSSIVCSSKPSTLASIHSTSEVHSVSCL
jgi:hypothetical protein